eukprot:2533313-Pyramimonas_sp.AAC.1
MAVQVQRGVVLHVLALCVCEDVEIEVHRPVVQGQRVVLLHVLALYVREKVGVDAQRPVVLREL